MNRTFSPLNARGAIALLGLAAATLIGCERNAVLLPNSDGSLNKSANAFADDAAARFPYPATLTRGGDLQIRAEIGYMWNVITVVNYSQQPWDNVELWVNKNYVVGLQRLEPGKTTRVAFKMIFDNAGQHLPESGVLVDTLELKKDGMMYTVPKQLGG